MRRPPSAPKLRELQRYLSRVGERWPLQIVMLGGARVAELRGLDPPPRPRDLVAEPAGPGPLADAREPEYVVVLVSQGFDGMPWLERVYQASALWDGLEMGEAADVHPYTPAEFARRRETAPAVRAVVERGLLLYEDTAGAAG